MAFSWVLSVAIFQIVFLAAAGDIITFNQEINENDDSIESLLEMEQFLQVSSAPNNRKLPQAPVASAGNNKNRSPPINAKLPVQLDKKLSGSAGSARSSNTENRSGSSAVGTSSMTGRVFPGQEEFGSRLAKNESSYGLSERSREAEERRREAELDEYLMYSDALLLPVRGEDLGEDAALWRERRQVPQFSGEIAVTFQIVVDGDLTAQELIDGSPENEALKASIADALKLFLESVISGVTFDVTIQTLTPFNSFIIDGTLVYMDEDATRVQIAQALYDLDLLDQFKVGSQVYAVSFPTLEPASTTTQKAAICFLCESYQTCTQNDDLTWSCIVADNRLYTFGLAQGDSTLARNDEFASAEIVLEPPIPYDSDLLDSVWISVNGIISFGEEFSSFSPSPLPVDDRKLLAVYWSDLDLLDFDSASVFYHLYTKDVDNTVAEQAILARANTDVVALVDDVAAYDATVVIVITWDGLPPWPAESSLAERVTFQCVIISDGQTTYASYLYADGAMNFEPILDRAVEVGWGSTNFDVPLNYYEFDKVIGNTDELGRWFFLVGLSFNSESLCQAFVSANVPFLPSIDFFNVIVPPCPCNEIVAVISFFWIPSFLQPRCYDMFPVFGTLGRRCCYQLDGSVGFENRLPLAGNLQFFTPYFGDLVNHDTFDSTPKRWCCEESQLCDAYYAVRPVRRCTNRGFRRAQLVGDPHINTLDDKTYSFNGLGEYRLLEISNGTTLDFKLQGRTCQATNTEGELVDATVWCAIALVNTNGTSVRIGINPAGTNMIIYANDQDYSVRFRENPNFQEQNGGIVLQRINNSLLISTPDRIGITVALVNKLLDWSTEVDELYRGAVMAEGLLGNYNGDDSDDFVYPNGTQISANSTDRELFPYCQSWAVTEENSLFQYGFNQSTSTFSDPSFTPIFLSDFNTTIRDAADAICNGNLQCVFDYLATQDQQLAEDTLNAVETFNEEEQITGNEAPIISGGSSQINVTVNETTVIVLTGSDPENGAIQYVILDSPSSDEFNYTTDNTTLTAEFRPVDVSAVAIEIVAQDPQGLNSEITAIPIVVCSNCSGNGQCDFANVRNTVSITYSEASCVCDTPYSGPDCASDKDGCRNQPCPALTQCTDISAEEEARTNIAYNCSDCPDGFTFNVNRTKCEDIDECQVSNPCDSNANCTNKFGGYMCDCHRGYRMSSLNTCVDVNECVENSHSCEQICINEPGTYSCGCENGFDLSGVAPFLFNCSQLSIDPCANLTSNLTCSYGCRNNSGEAECFCRVGFQVAADGVSCENINECNENLCAQKCEDNEGSYVCSCFNGYQLGEDGLSCNVCPENSYGESCSKRCQCRGRATGCDSVRGCLCVPEWTGEFCNIDVDECANPISCPEDQNCRNLNGSFVCECPTGFEDTFKNGSCYNIDECATASVSQCPQICTDNPGSFACSCRAGYNYIIANNTCEDIDECVAGISGCEHSCVNMEGSFNCLCNPGFVLRDDRINCIQESEVCNNYNVSCGFACTVRDGNPECFCQNGYYLDIDGFTCLDVNECIDADLNKCSAECVNIPGTYECLCPVGQKLQNDQRGCEACDDYHWGDNCTNVCACDPKGSVTCLPETGCSCLPGYSGEYCELDRNECANEISPCPAGAICNNLMGSFTCVCGVGYQLNASGICVDIDECLSNPCDHTCTNTVGSFICTCFDGFISQGFDCIDINECNNKDLNNCSQTCRNTQGGFTCECFEGFLLNITDRIGCYPESVNSVCSTSNSCSDICRLDNGVETCLCQEGYALNTTDNSTCNDVNECSTNPCVDGNCINSPGTFSCVCESGRKLAQDKLTCQVCEAGFYGNDCAIPCSCDAANTESCLPENGTCVCNTGWNGTDCSQNVNECESTNCGADALCEDTPGSFKCVCNLGFFRSGDDVCVACDATHWGANCASECSCEESNTIDCNDITGVCQCEPTWQGDNCTQDVNECDFTNCTGPFETCTNLEGSYECSCVRGYNRPNIGADCQECDTTFFGQGCSSTCSCVFPNTRDCEHVTGQCLCTQEWTGVNCTDDVDVCVVNSSYCTGPHERCQDLVGATECLCVDGYERPTAGADCQDVNECLDVTLDTCGTRESCQNTEGSFECLTDYSSYVFTVTFGYGYDEVDPLVFINTTSAFRALRQAIETSLLNFAQSTVGSAIQRVAITNFVNGSVIAQGDIEIDNNQTNNAPGIASAFTYSLDRLTSLTINQSAVPVETVTIEGTLVTSQSIKCSIFNDLITCQCVVVDEIPECRPEDAEDSDYELIIGLGVGIPLFFILTTVVAVLVYLYVKRKSDKMETSSTPSQDRDAPFRSVFATQMATKGSWGAPHRFQMYSPDAYSEAGTSNSSGDGQLLKARQQKGRSDFQDSPWYDNKGATPRDREATESRGAPTEAAGPTSNFSWEYMFRLLEPHREFEIQRPNITPAPNPMYTPRSRKPDSMA